MPSMFPYDWAGGGTDMLLFSVRRGSAVVGMPDSIFGIPIEPGDILTTPLAPAMGGVSPFPGILIAAENLGLATKRSMGVPYGDELDALDTERLAFFDCNGNGREDALDIALGSSNDNNNNGIPDECELIVKYSCYCPAPGVCGNPDPSAGCRNSTGAGALLTATGTSSVTADNLILTTTQAPPFVPGILIQGRPSALQCRSTTVLRLRRRSAAPLAAADLERRGNLRVRAGDGGLLGRQLRAVPLVDGRLDMALPAVVPRSARPVRDGGQRLQRRVRDLHALTRRASGRIPRRGGAQRCAAPSLVDSRENDSKHGARGTRLAGAFPLGRGQRSGCSGVRLVPHLP
jgi:hypothetical protein